MFKKPNRIRIMQDQINEAIRLFVEIRWSWQKLKSLIEKNDILLNEDLELKTAFSEMNSAMNRAIPYFTQILRIM